MQINNFFILTSVALTLGMSDISAKETPQPAKPVLPVDISIDKTALATSALESLYRADLPALSLLFTNNFIDYDAGDSSSGIGSMIKLSNELRMALPDANFMVDEIQVFENKVLILGKIFGSHIGPFRGMIPSGRMVTLKTADLFEFEGRLIKSRRGVRDLMPLTVLADPSLGSITAPVYPIPSMTTSNIENKDSLRPVPVSQPPDGKKKSLNSKDSKKKKGKGDHSSDTKSSGKTEKKPTSK